MKQSKILIIGTLPEAAGIGGVTIHIKRLLQWLDKSSYPYDLCNYRVLPLTEKFMQMRKHKATHIHISKPLPRLIYILYCLLVGTKSILTIHGNIGRFTWLKNKMDEWSVRLCNVPVLINQKSFDKAMKWNKNSVMLSAFLPPVDEGYLPECVIIAIEKARTDGKEIIACNASVMSYTDAGEEIYGITFAVDYFKEKKNYFLCVSDPSGQYAEKYKDEKFDNILFITEQHSFYKLVKHADVMLRPTATDGDALSVKEGLFWGKKVIATDRVDRPNGVIAFKYNDRDTLEETLKKPFLANNNLTNENVAGTLIEIYNRLLK